MKKRIIATVCLLVSACMLMVGCSSNTVAKETTAAATTAAATEAAATEAGALKTGLAILTTTTGSKDAGEKDGLTQAYTTVAAVTLNGETITSCVIDAVQAKVNFDATGKITSELTDSVKTKVQLGDEYGMRKASAIGKEWNEQAAAFSAYVTGKTVADVNGIAVTEEGKATDADLTASVTVKLGAFKEIFAKIAE
ncbi:MAG: hypothetical protein Q4B67_05580 [Eubacteriales bacterium]|nr:hypothetical protein [Eubacteriales bacterium]